MVALIGMLLKLLWDPKQNVPSYNGHVATRGVKAWAYQIYKEL